MLLASLLAWAWRCTGPEPRSPRSCPVPLGDGSGYEPAPEGFVLVPPGTFLMGTDTPPDPRFGYSQDATPRHEVTITRAYYIGAGEVTHEEWRAAMANEPWWCLGCGDDAPVELVTWWEALAYCNARSLSEGLVPCYDLSGCLGRPGEYGFRCPTIADPSPDCEGYRLPTEAEWEFAARAGTEQEFLCSADAGADCVADLAWTNIARDGVARLRAVEGGAPNCWGLYNVLGNVSEMVWDGSSDYPDRAVIDPVVSTADPNGARVLRGRGIRPWPLDGGVSERRFISPGFSEDDRGFRIARTATRTGGIGR